MQEIDADFDSWLAANIENTELHGVDRVRSHGRFRKRDTESLSKPGIKWMSGSAKRQCGRTLGVEPALAQAFLEQRQSGDKGPADVSTVAQGKPRALKSFSHAPVYFCIVVLHCTT